MPTRRAPTASPVWCPPATSPAGRARPGQHISREGSVELRQAVIELGRGLWQHDADFVAYRRRLLDAKKDEALKEHCRSGQRPRHPAARLDDQGREQWVTLLTSRPAKCAAANVAGATS
ncbi:MAG: hypothetical protein M3083_09900 [Actinomycetota bacterium]|nr:hypothetical protein [Actinomycetota bacterium]MDQ6948056.1 hypothetical protein [Actinomycetota bacterium]